MLALIAMLILSIRVALLMLLTIVLMLIVLACPPMAIR